MDTINKNNEDTLPLTPEEIKAIGEISLGPSRHEQFLNAHYKKLMWGGITLGIAAGVIIAYFSNRNDMRHEAASQVVQAMQITSPGMGMAGAEDYDTAVLSTLSQEYGQTPSADTAALLSSLSLLAKGDESAVSAIENFAAGNAILPLCARALAALATHLQQQGKDAADTWTRLVQLEANPYTALGYLMLGDMAKNKGEKHSARSYYQQCVEKCPTSVLVTNKTVEMRLALLDVDAPTPVEPIEQPSETPSSNPLGNPLGENPLGETPEVGNTEFNPGF